MSGETVHSFRVLEALFLLPMSINEIAAFWFRFLVMSLWRDLNVDDDFSAMISQDRISTDTSVVFNMFLKD